jgi:multimeric flavodoxin WrbA
VRKIKTLIINGSPRKNGDSMTLINELMKYLEGEVKVVHTYYDNIKPCLDCRFCWANNGCCIKDDMQEIYRLLDEVDNVIIASPIYFSELTGKMLSFASRLQTYYARKYIRLDKEFMLKEKKGFLILTGGGDGSPKPAISRANIIFKYINAKLIGSVFSLNTNMKPSKEDTEAIDKIKEYAIVLNQTDN